MLEQGEQSKVFQFTGFDSKWNDSKIKGGDIMHKSHSGLDRTNHFIVGALGSTFLIPECSKTERPSNPRGCQ